ncbi:Aldo/keto reductase [Dendrothele bispora CBS 962.96]|uniref:Aldo/keto reductase n=1 Tax=Dendrothele bispora (strain CBS 962.96) TaxID=1314807 RepID=A0A4S8LV98_DENBC|nr:Aldo/keto reductase [Dendrothele bispora CBS 962.96]
MLTSPQCISLSRLKTNYIDLLQIHRFDSNVTPEEIMKALHDLVQTGKVRYIGASSMRCWQFALLNEVADKTGWTKFYLLPVTNDCIRLCKEREMHYYHYHGIGLIPWAPVAAGLLAHPVGEETTRTESGKGTVFQPKLTDWDNTIITRVQEVAEKRGKSMAQIALAWVNEKVASPIVGTSSEKRVEDAVEVNGVKLTEEEMKYLEEPYEPRAVRGHA